METQSQTPFATLGITEKERERKRERERERGGRGRERWGEGGRDKGRRENCTSSLGGRVLVSGPNLHTRVEW